MVRKGHPGNGMCAVWVDFIWETSDIPTGMLFEMGFLLIQGVASKNLLHGTTGIDNGEIFRGGIY